MRERGTLHGVGDGETEWESEGERTEGERTWNKKLIFSLQLCYSAILPLELHSSKYCKKFAILGFDIF